MGYNTVVLSRLAAFALALALIGCTPNRSPAVSQNVTWLKGEIADVWTAYYALKKKAGEDPAMAKALDPEIRKLGDEIGDLDSVREEMESQTTPQSRD